ncbi:pentapeptide repeat protein [Calothrix parasitica NIES-267]|uniref:Pentapeptide repeat protein n=1 Tax=Calothrix parasitica NIES-267 TaxID=1973488 RepID=A0A1Z4LN52_9CYAN|nr:pentapeptide repeat protein [Calothrix parasitica NIES-267]
MTNNQNQPNKYDAVLGGNAPPPIHGAVLGGIEGVKKRLASSDIHVQISALNDALNYGDLGLDTLINTLKHESVRIRQYTYKLLQDKEETQVKQALKDYKFWTGFEKYYEFPTNHATTFANREVIEFEPKIGITETANTAYAIRVADWDFASKPILSTEKLEILQQNPLAHQIEALVIGFWYTKGLSLIDAFLNASENLTNLKALCIGDIHDREYYLTENINISYLLLAYPNLEVIKISFSNFISYTYNKNRLGLEINSIRHENLKALIIECEIIDFELIYEIYNLELPTLEYFELWSITNENGSTLSRLGIKELMQVFYKIFPKLKYLGIRNCKNNLEDLNHVPFGIVESSIIENLVELDLSMGSINDEGAEALLNCPSIKNLDTLDVSDNYLSDEMVERLKQLDIEVIADRQEPDYLDYELISF